MQALKAQHILNYNPENWQVTSLVEDSKLIFYLFSKKA